MKRARAIYRAHPTDAEIADVLAQLGTATLGTLNADGSIHLAYVIYLFEDGRFYLETSSVTRKARNIAARGTASILVEGRAETGRSLMVEAEGTARVIEPPEAQAIADRVRARYLAADVAGAVNRLWNQLDDIAIEIEPARWRSWTNAALRNEIETGLGRSYDEVWRD